MSAQIEAYPEALRPLLRTIIGDIRELRAVFPNKKFIGATVEMLRGGASGREPQVWHYDGTSTDKDGTVHDAKPRFTRILKTYDGPGVQIANQDQTKMMDAPTGSVAIYTSGLQGPLHRGPGLKPGEHRLRLFIELSE
jgi:hypothetical protein